jgi:Zn finger protein HypA/HybF involved in hydrogenase expression
LHLGELKQQISISKKTTRKPLLTEIKLEVGSVHCTKYARMKIALEENLHPTYVYETIFIIIACRTSNKMCPLLIEVLLFTISSGYIHFFLL